jgi:predicted amidohydrolase
MATIGVDVIQMHVGWDPDENAHRMVELLDGAELGDVVVTPEGSVSGYPSSGDVGDLSLIDHAGIERALDGLEGTAQEKGIVLWVGVVRKLKEGWVNEAIALSAEARRTYRKCNLATLERDLFLPGSSLPTFDVAAARAGVQICRELRFPEQWIGLALAGAQVLLHLNNASGSPEASDVWRSMLVARAHETQRWVASANAAHAVQHSPSVVLAPTGDVVLELETGGEASQRAELDLGVVRDDYLNQRTVLSPSRVASA